MKVSRTALYNFPAGMHHGVLSGEFEPRWTGTDYCDFYHKLCNSKALIMGVVLDYQMRIVFTVKCLKCGKVDALKFSIDFPEVYNALENSDSKTLELVRKIVFKLSPEYEKCVR